MRYMTIIAAFPTCSSVEAFNGPATAFSSADSFRRERRISDCFNNGSRTQIRWAVSSRVPPHPVPFELFY